MRFAAYVMSGALAGLLACAPVVMGEAVAQTPPKQTVDPAAAETARLTAFLDKAFERELSDSPERATRLGLKTKYGQLDDRSEKAQLLQLEWRRKSVAEMKASFDRAKLSPDAQVYYDMWVQALERAELQWAYRSQDYPFGRSAPHTELVTFMIDFHKVDTKEDLAAYEQRVSQIGNALRQSLERVKAASGKGVRMPKFQYERVIAECKKLTDPKNANPILKDGEAKVKKLVDTGKLSAKDGRIANMAIEKNWMATASGYGELVKWLEADLPNAPVGATGSVSLPDGLKWYQAAIELQTTTKMTADEIHQLGLAEVKRIHGEMDTLAKTAGFADRAAFLKDRDGRKELVLPNTDEGRAEYLKIANAEVARTRGMIAPMFISLPKYGMEVRREPAYSEVPGGAAHASRATPDGSKPGIVFQHLLTPTGYIKTEITDLMCHEAVPGHLMQGDIAVRLKGVPKFKSAYGNAAFNEGWALYAERLCKELGVYQNAWQDYARLDGELWRAVRLVVDTGLHAKGWTPEQAEQYARENTTEDASKITQEVKRFLINPGQATAYKVGERTIMRLRGEAQAALGDRFDIKAFHEVVIGSGATPLSILERRVRDWVAQTKAAQAKP